MASTTFSEKARSPAGAESAEFGGASGFPEPHAPHRGAAPPLSVAESAGGYAGSRALQRLPMKIRYTAKRWIDKFPRYASTQRNASAGTKTPIPTTADSVAF
jgi:hypothetical protein